MNPSPFKVELSYLTYLQGWIGKSVGKSVNRVSPRFTKKHSLPERVGFFGVTHLKLCTPEAEWP